MASQGVDKARLNGKNAATDDERRIYYDGPAKNAKGVSDIVTEVGGLSLSPGDMLNDANALLAAPAFVRPPKT